MMEQRKNIRLFDFPIAACALIVLLTSATISDYLKPVSANFQILEQSKLSLDGSSNVNKFTCNCLERFAPMSYTLTTSADRTQVFFEHTTLRMTTTKLDCGNKMMNKDMYQTLKASEHPTITIELRKATFPPGVIIDDCAEWVEMNAETVITIAGKARKVPLKIKARNLAAGRYQFRSSQTLQMTDFGIEPPVAVMGMVKVKNEITINFDLFVSARKDS